jgi:hypothetical protein
VTEEERREKHIGRYMARCVHFNGIQNESCEAGVNYEEMRGEKIGCLPCFSDEPTPLVCDKRSLPTREQAEAHETEVANACRNFSLASSWAARRAAIVLGFGKKAGGQSSLACPACGTGQIRYSVASYNGHMQARCTTAGCVSWME